uniref:ZP domain-containing protein n=1 Tax=Parastrongyloides trichosuri TaxID=131310 RepID=A0A0N4Z518_PARTI
MIYFKFLLFYLTSTIFTYASVPIITLHDGHITLYDNLLKKEYHGSIVPGKPYTIDIYLSQSEHNDYVIESCVYNNKTNFITHNGCINVDGTFVDKWETTNYGIPGALKRTLIHFIAPEATLHVHCLLRLIECCSCAEKSCENPIGFNDYPYTPYQLIMTLPPPFVPTASVLPSILPGFSAPAQNGLIVPQKQPIARKETSIWDQWWFWLILILAFLLLCCLPCLLGIFYLLKKRREKKIEKEKSEVFKKDNNGYISSLDEDKVHDQVTQTTKDVISDKKLKEIHTIGHQHRLMPTNLDIYKLERDSLFSHSSDSFINDEFETTMSHTKSAKIMSNPHSTSRFHRHPTDIPENIIHEVRDHMTTKESSIVKKPLYRESQNYSELSLKKDTYIPSSTHRHQHQDALRRPIGASNVPRAHESVFI